MKWEGDKGFKEIITEEGYHLKVKYKESHNAYWWGAFKDGQIIYVSQPDDYKKTLSGAQKAAQQRMIRDILDEGQRSE
ncbi:hypothetical protein [Ascidiimonas aurantiaca]|uniref:hypothetical protein n=1 Tax=Ascidiimonas aurantiaca TaxID=1685432 RepID=UPI0030EDBD8C